MVLLSTAACGLLPVPRLVFDRPQPPIASAPPPTSLPGATITFKVHVPAGTPAGSAPAVRLLDTVGGASSIIVLANIGNNLWSGKASEPVGAVIRYKYVRPLPSNVEETTAVQQPVRFRLYAVGPCAATVDDIVAGWSDLPIAGDVGGMDGRVWNGNNGQGVMGILVSAGGQQTLTAHDDTFTFHNLPAGSQRASLLAPDGALSPAQQTVTIGRAQMVPVDLLSADPNAVHLTFLVRPPAGVDPGAVLRLAGDVIQLGDTLVPAANGSTIGAAREPVLPPLADGRWIVRQQFCRYCRNFACGTADDAATAGNGPTGRFFGQALFDQNLRDNITDWQWLDGPSGGACVLPINVHQNFAAGFDQADDWQPNAILFYAQAFDATHADGAGWVNFTRLVSAQMQPAPNYADDPALAAPAPDWASIVSTAHSVGLRVSLHPVTCHYTPYGACDNWNGVNFGGGLWDSWFAAYQRYLLTEATLARNSAADRVVNSDFKLRPSFPGKPEAPPDAEARWRALIAKVRGVYGRPLAIELLMPTAVWPSPPPFLDAVDVIRVWCWTPPSNNNRPGIADLTPAAGVLLDGQWLPVQWRFNKPLHLSVAYLAADGAASQCLGRPAGQCYSFEDFAPGVPNVAAYPLDLAEQGDIYQALLTAVNDCAWVSGVFSYRYYPVAILHGKSLSVPGKPAEGVLAAWFPKLQGH